jgi:hypothetical protein
MAKPNYAFEKRQKELAKKKKKEEKRLKKREGGIDLDKTAESAPAGGSEAPKDSAI